MSMAPISRLSPPSPQLANQRTGGVFNLRSSEECLQSSEYYMGETAGRCIQRLLLDYNISSNTPVGELQEGDKVVKIFRHPKNPNTSVILTNEHALALPVKQAEWKAYTENASKKGKIFSVETREAVDLFLKNTLLPDLDIKG